MEHSSCPLCGHDVSSVIRQITSSDHYLNLIEKPYASIRRCWLRCELCSHVHNSVKLRDSELKSLYARFRDQEWRNESPDQYFERITSLSEAESENFQKFSIIEEFTGICQLSEGSVLDIGCGGGVLIEEMSRRLQGKFEFFGVEPTSSFAELARRRTGAQVANQNYMCEIFGERKFDLITCCQVLEHVRAPIEFLTDIHSDLTDVGYLYLEVPDISDFETLPEDHDRFMVQHVSYFSESVLRAALERSGFRELYHGITKTIRDRNNLWFVSQLDG